MRKLKYTCIFVRCVFEIFSLLDYLFPESSRMLLKFIEFVLVLY